MKAILWATLAISCVGCGHSPTTPTPITPSPTPANLATSCTVFVVRDGFLTCNPDTPPPPPPTGPDLGHKP